MKKYRFTCIIFILFSLSLFPKSIVLKEEAVVFDESIKLRDIALMDNQLIQLCGELKIAASPDFKRITVLKKSEIREKLSNNGYLDIILEGSNEVIVTKSGNTVKQSFLKKLITNYIKNNSQWKENFEISIQSTKKLIIPAGDISWEIHPANGQDFFQNMLFKIKAYQNTRQVLSDWLPVKLKIYRNIALTKGIIYKGEMILEDNIRWERRELDRSLKDAFFDKNRIYGQRVSRTISANTVITRRILQEDFFVRRGQEAILTANYRSVSASLKVIPLTNGRNGDYIKVVNSNSKKVLYAKVIGKGELEVDVK